MSSVYAMIVKADGPIFDKGDIVTGRQDSADFGAKVLNNPKFHIIEVLNTTMEEAESLLSPLVINQDNEDLQQELKPRSLTVDVDYLLDKESISKAEFMSLITQKEVVIDIQNEEVIV